jgi:SulP family sulfate permease
LRLLPFLWLWHLGIASGTTPDKGLITAVIAGFLISFLGGSRVQIGGPTGAFVVVVFNIIGTHGYDGLVLATLMAGVILVIAGFVRLGTWIKYIPQPVITGFTAGIAVIIFSSQIKDIFGLEIEKVPGDFFEKWEAFWTARDSVNLVAFLCISRLPRSYRFNEKVLAKASRFSSCHHRWITCGLFSRPSS